MHCKSLYTIIYIDKKYFDLFWVDSHNTMDYLKLTKCRAYLEQWPIVKSTFNNFSKNLIILS